MNRGWRKGQKEKFLATMAAKKIAKEKPGGNVHNNLSPGIFAPTPPFDLGQAQEDSRRNAEFQYRRGLVTALECILRELR